MVEIGSSHICFYVLINHMLENGETIPGQAKFWVITENWRGAGRPGLAGGGFYHLVQSSEIVWTLG